MTFVVCRANRGWLLVLLMLASAGLCADEGMWTFDNPPLAVLRARYGFTPPAGWLDHLRLSSVRFEDGGSGSFVSADGLVLTNHHVASEALQKMGTKTSNPYRDGFYAKTRDQEYKIEAMEINVLMDITDVTERVNAAVKP